MSDANTPSVEYNEMAARWAPIDALKSGTPGMRAARTTYLPKEPAESDEAYNIRLNRSILYEALPDTIEKVTELPFSQPVTVTDDTFEITDDVDGLGTNITQFSKVLMDDMASYGKCHILVDFPSVEGPLTLAEQLEQDVRPYWTHLSPKDLIAWTYEGTKLTSVRFRQTVVESTGRFSTAYVHYVYEYTLDTISKFYKDGDEWKLESETPNTLGEIPLVTAYANKSGEMCACPPYEKLAWLNIAHWQSQSDQYNILRVARFAILFGKGLSADDVENDTVIGPMNMIKTESENADMKYVEHQGYAIGAGRQQLQDLQAMMEVVGTQPLIDRSGNTTATGKAIDASKNQSSVQSWIRALEHALSDAYYFHAKWLESESTFKAKIFSDFKVSLFGTTDVDILSRLCMAGKLATSTLLKELKRRGLLVEDLDVEEELENIETENLNLIGFGDVDDQRTEETPEEVDPET